MRQQVNLFQPIFRRQKKVFSAMAMLQVSMVALLFFLLTAGYSLLQLRKLEAQEAAATRNLDKLKERIASIRTRSRDDTGAKLLEEEINRISGEVSEKQRVAELLKQGPFTNTEGFTRHFEALARQHVEGTWLTEIRIADGGTVLSLDGITLSAEYVAEYMQRLLQDRVFAGTAFNVLGMERSAAKPDEITFQVGTHVAGKKDENS